jgi:hypothetical protein
MPAFTDDAAVSQRLCRYLGWSRAELTVNHRPSRRRTRAVRARLLNHSGRRPVVAFMLIGRCGLVSPTATFHRRPREIDCITAGDTLAVYRQTTSPIRIRMASIAHIVRSFLNTVNQLQVVFADRLETYTCQPQLRDSTSA